MNFKNGGLTDINFNKKTFFLFYYNIFLQDYFKKFTICGCVFYSTLI